MKKRILITFVVMSLLAMSLFTGCGSQNSNDSKSNNVVKKTKKISDLVDGTMYVFNGTDYIPTKTYQQAFEYDIVSDPDIERIIWDTELNNEDIPTLYEGDSLILCTSDVLPEYFTWERFYDLGDTFGLRGLILQQSEKYSMDLSEQNLLQNDSTAFKINELYDEKTVIINAVGDKTLNTEAVSVYGTIIGLEKNKTYNVDVYIGTYRNTYKLKADTRAFGSMEVYKGFKYTLLKDNVAELIPPESALTGYYYVNGYGFIRYIKGIKYDDKTDFNVFSEIDYNNPEGPSVLYENYNTDIENDTDYLKETDSNYDEYDVN